MVIFHITVNVQLNDGLGRRHITAQNLLSASDQS